MRRHPQHHLSPARASYRAGPDPEARLSRPKSPQQRSDQARKPVISEQDSCSIAWMIALMSGRAPGPRPRTRRACHSGRLIEYLTEGIEEYVLFRTLVRSTFHRLTWNGKFLYAFARARHGSDY